MWLLLAPLLIGLAKHAGKRENLTSIVEMLQDPSDAPAENRRTLNPGTSWDTFQDRTIEWFISGEVADETAT